MKKLEFKTEKFDLGPRHSLGIVAYIAASMGYSKEEIKQIVGGNFAKLEGVLEFHKILSEPLDNIQQAEYKEEVKDLLGPFNLVEQIQKVINLILEKSDCDDPNLHMSAMVYKNSPFKFDNLVNKPKEEPKMTAREEYLRDEALIAEHDEERLEELKQLDELVKQRVEEELQKRESLEKERQEERQKKFREEMMSGIFQRPFSQPRPTSSGPFKFKPVVGARNSEEIEEVNQAIESLVRLRNKLISNLNEPIKEQANVTQDELQKAEEQPKPYEPVKFTEEQRQRLRDILNNQNGATSRYDQIGNGKVKKLNEYVIRSNTGNEYVPYSYLSPLDDKPLFDQMLHDRTETEAMISRSIEIYPSMDLCKDTLFKVNKPEEMFSFVRVDGDRLYRINDSSVQPWNRSKPLGTIRLVKEDFGLFTSVKLTVEVNESIIDDIVDRNYVDVISILKDINKKHGTSIKPDDINADLPAENLGQYLLRNTFSSLVAEVRKDRAHLIKTLVRDSAIVVINDMELTNWLNGKNPTNS